MSLIEVERGVNGLAVMCEVRRRRGLTVLEVVFVGDVMVGGWGVYM